MSKFKSTYKLGFCTHSGNKFSPWVANWKFWLMITLPPHPRRERPQKIPINADPGRGEKRLRRKLELSGYTINAQLFNCTNATWVKKCKKERKEGTEWLQMAEQIGCGFPPAVRSWSDSIKIREDLIREKKLWNFFVNGRGGGSDWFHTSILFFQIPFKHLATPFKHP